MKRFIIAFIAAYIFLFVWGWLLNGVLLKDVYAETAHLWRLEHEMRSSFHWIIIGQALVVFSFVMIYASGFAGGGVIAGFGSVCCWKSQRLGCALAFMPSNRFPEN